MTGQQVDLFLDQLVDAPLKDEQRLMEFPFFSLQKQPRLEPFLYDDGKVRIEISPGKKGIATIWDKDILIYIGSLLNERIERGQPVNRTITFPAYDFLRVTSRGTGKRAYELFLDALFRLRSTTIVTTIEAGGQTERRGFGWIESWRIVERLTSGGKTTMAAVEITINDWMFRSIVRDRRVLTISRDYFQLGMGIERRLYELARKHAGTQPEWWIGLERLHEKCGSLDTLRKFKHRIKAIAEAQTLPDYRVEMVEPSEARVPFQTASTLPVIRFSPKQPPVLKAAETPVAAPLSSTFAVPDVPSLRSATYDEAARRHQGYDIEHLVTMWQQWTRGQGRALTNPDKAFLAFCETFVRNNPIP
jgi:plasmid replication initiation protein